MPNYEVVYNMIVRLGGARLDRLVTECGMSRRTVSSAIHELDVDYMVHRVKNVWYPTSATPQKVGKAAKSGEVGNDRSLACQQTGNSLGSEQACLYPDALPAGFLEEEEYAGMAPHNAGPTGCKWVVEQDADLPVVMRRIVDDLVHARTQHNRLEGIRTVRARISRKKRAINLLDTEHTRDLYVLARLLWVARTDNTWDTDQAFRAWLTADMDRSVRGWREQVNQVVVEIGVAV